MKLFIDTSNAEKIILQLDGTSYETAARREKSQLLLPFIEEVLSKNKAQFTDLTEIEVAVGNGSFTGLRVGVSVAQTLGWALNTPVNNQNIVDKQFIDINYAPSSLK